jgi:tetratricopeptide (TPR) repeat protein
MNMENSVVNLNNLFANGNYKTIIKKANGFLKANPIDLNVLTIIAQVYFHEKEYENSIKIFKKLVKYHPNKWEAYNNLGNALRGNGNLSEALANFDKAIKLKPDYFQAFNSYGSVLYDQNKIYEAIECFKRALELKPDYILALRNLSIALISVGDFDKAKQSLKRIIEIEPQNIDAHFELSKLIKYSINNHHIADLQDILSNSKKTIKSEVLINYALGKAMSDIKNYGVAFNHWRKANDTFKNHINYTFEEDKNLFININKLVDQKNIKLDVKKFEKEPIFIVGMPRSGTSLIEQILSGHSKIYGAGEIEYLSQTFKEIFTKELTLNKNLLRSIRERYIKGIEYSDVEKTFFTDKAPLNFRWIGIIKSMFPDAPILSLKRHPVAICFSHYRNFFQSHGMSYSNNLIDIGNYYIFYEKVMSRWLEKYPEIITIEYEKLTKEPDRSVKLLIESLKLKWEDNCLNFNGNNRPVKTVSNVQIREKIYKNSSEEWENYKDFLDPLINLFLKNGINV